jgi:hypothetical protein
LRAVVLAVGILIGAVVLGGILIPKGEVAMLSTFAENGVEQETAVWVVEGDGLGGASELFLRTGPETGWLARLRTNPAVELERAGETRAYLAKVEEDAATRARINEAMAAKYGFANRIVGVVIDHEIAVPIRLVPDPNRKPAEHASPH